MVMKYIFSVLPMIVAIFVFILKRVAVNAQSGKKYAFREFLIDGGRFLLVFFCSILAYFLYGKDVPAWTLLIDISMLLVYLFPLLSKNYDFVQRKALMGIWASCIILIVLAVTMFHMLIGTYEMQDNTLLYCFLKTIIYFGIAIWCCSTTEKKGFFAKIKELFRSMIESYKCYVMTELDYFCVAFLTLFIFVGKEYFTPIGIFGLHEIMNKRKCKGILWMIVGNLCLYLRHHWVLWGEIIFLIYVCVALVDLLIFFIRSRKKSFRQK